MRKITITAQFEKKLKLIRKRGYDLSRLSVVIKLLAQGELRERKFKDHPLKGKYEGLRECHLTPDWLLIYYVTEDEVTLLTMGTHSELFK